MVFKEHSCLFLNLEYQDPKIQTQSFIALLSLLFREFGAAGFKEPITKALKSHSCHNCFEASF